MTVTKDPEYYKDKKFRGDEERPIMTLSKKLILNVAPTGYFVNREQNPNQPYTPEDVAREIAESYREGAAMCHIHIRDAQGVPDKTPESMIRVFDLIREQCPDIITTVNVRGGESAAKGIYGRHIVEEVIDPILKAGHHPDMITTAPTSKAPTPGAPFVMNEKILREWIAYLNETNIKPEIQCYEYEAIKNFEEWIHGTELARKPYYINIVSGHHAFWCSGPTYPHPWGAIYLATIKEGVPFPSQDVVYGAVLGGRNWLPLTVEAILLGYDVLRLGMEDAVLMYPHREEKIRCCADTIRKIRVISEELGREIATPKEARKIMGIG